MQEDARRRIAGENDSTNESGVPITTRVFRSRLGIPTARGADFLPVSCFPYLPQTQGWTVKAPEFINSGPPALLNNPCCCRRVVFDSFLKHAMEVQHG